MWRASSTAGRENDERHATAVVELHSRLRRVERHRAAAAQRVDLPNPPVRTQPAARVAGDSALAHEEPLRQSRRRPRASPRACLTAVEPGAEEVLTAPNPDSAPSSRTCSCEMGMLAREVREAVAEMRQGAPQRWGHGSPGSVDNVVLVSTTSSAPRAGWSAAVRVGRGLALAEAVEVGRHRPPARPRTAAARGRVRPSRPGRAGWVPVEVSGSRHRRARRVCNLRGRRRSAPGLREARPTGGGGRARRRRRAPARRARHRRGATGRRCSGCGRPSRRAQSARDARAHRVGHRPVAF